MSEMVERVARALHRASVGETAKWDGLRLPEQQYYEEHARAAIAALREPTEAMIAALLRKKFLDATDHNRDVITLDWQTMIDEAQKG